MKKKSVVRKKNRYVTLSDAIDEKFRDNRKKLLGETKLKTLKKKRKKKKKKKLIDVLGKKALDMLLETLESAEFFKKKKMYRNKYRNK